MSDTINYEKDGKTRSLPSDYFENNPSVEGSILDEGVLEWRTGDPTFQGGTFLPVEGAEFPMKGIPFPDAIWSVNMVKKTLIEPLKMAAMWQMWPSLMLMALSPKKKLVDRLMRPFGRLAFGAMGHRIISDRYRTPVCDELDKIIQSFLEEMDMDPYYASLASKCIAHVFEYDMAYRYRLQDIMSETGKAALMQKPIREISRLSEIMQERELNPSVKKKLRLFKHAACFALMSPSIRRAFRNAIEPSSFDRLQLDDSDRYWCMTREDYKYMGQTPEENRLVMNLLGWKVPDSYPVDRNVV